MKKLSLRGWAVLVAAACGIFLFGCLRLGGIRGAGAGLLALSGFGWGVLAGWRMARPAACHLKGWERGVRLGLTTLAAILSLATIGVGIKAVARFAAAAHYWSGLAGEILLPLLGVYLMARLFLAIRKLPEGWKTRRYIGKAA